MDIIRSQQNPFMRQLVKLQTAKGRKKQELYLLEGSHLVEAAIQAQETIQQIVLSEAVLEDYQSLMQQFPVTVVSEELFAKLSATESQQGILAVMPLQSRSSAEFVPGRYLLVDAVQDPGNLGTIIRTADAAGFDAVILGEGCVDVYNDKVIRSMQGSQFHIAIYQQDLQEVIEQMKSVNIPVAVTALHHQSVDYQWLTNQESVAIIVGNEGNGVRSSFIEQADVIIKIPMFGQAESLNVAIASAILMYQTRIEL